MSCSQAPPPPPCHPHLTRMISAVNGILSAFGSNPGRIYQAMRNTIGTPSDSKALSLLSLPSSPGIPSLTLLLMCLLPICTNPARTTSKLPAPYLDCSLAEPYRGTAHLSVAHRALWPSSPALEHFPVHIILSFLFVCFLNFSSKELTALSEKAQRCCGSNSLGPQLPPST